MVSDVRNEQTMNTWSSDRTERRGDQRNISRRHVFVCVLICTLVFLIYGQTLSFDFVSLDDLTYVTENPFVNTGITVRNSLAAFSFDGVSSKGNWIPLVWLSLMLDVEMWGDWAGGFHLTNIILHCANALLLYGGLLSLTRCRSESAVVAILFAIHPLHVESVAWVAERKDVLCTFFGFAAIWAYGLYGTRSWSGYYVISVSAFVCSLLAKQTFVTLPFLLLLLDFWPLGRCFRNDPRRNRPSDGEADVSAVTGDANSIRRVPARRVLLEKIPYLVLSLIFCGIVLVAQTHSMTQEVTLRSRVGNAAISYVRYVTKTVWPTDMSVFYPHPASEIEPLALWAATTFVVGASVAAVFVARRVPYVFTGWFWFLGTLVPMIGFVQVGRQQMADRYAYLPTSGLFVVIVWSLSGLHKRLTVRKSIVPVATLLVIAVWSLIAWRQASYWRSNVSLFEHGLSVTENNGQLHEWLAQALFADGRTAEAFAHFQRAAVLVPLDHILFEKWGACLSEAGRSDEAMEKFHQSLNNNPRHAPSHIGLGLLYERKGYRDPATDHFRAALSFDPRSSVAYYNLGRQLLIVGRLTEATTHFRSAIEFNPDYAMAHSNLGLAFYAQGRLEAAADSFRTAIRIDPSLEQAKAALTAIEAAAGN
ncbi:MAG TPA: tetratricopeptide repeat protein [Planctomycetes bacterium]|nr:tetratricopeptide repeat protein [Planctomycetota bacterium]